MGSKLLAIVVGLFLPLIPSTLGHLLGVANSAHLLTPVVVLFAFAGALLWQGNYRDSARLALIVVLAIPFGVILDVIIDMQYRGNDRNLFPFEIVLLWLIAITAMFFGMKLRKHVS